MTCVINEPCMGSRTRAALRSAPWTAATRRLSAASRTSSSSTAYSGESLIAVVGTWWVLGFGFAIHVIMTAVVVLTIVHVIAGRRRIADRDRHSPCPIFASKLDRRHARGR